jgi:hypothetical protein
MVQMLIVAAGLAFFVGIALWYESHKKKHHKNNKET